MQTGRPGCGARRPHQAPQTWIRRSSCRGAPRRRLDRPTPPDAGRCWGVPSRAGDAGCQSLSCFPSAAGGHRVASTSSRQPCTTERRKIRSGTGSCPAALQRPATRATPRADVIAPCHHTMRGLALCNGTNCHPRTDQFVSRMLINWVALAALLCVGEAAGSQRGSSARMPRCAVSVRVDLGAGTGADVGRSLAGAEGFAGAPAAFSTSALGAGRLSTRAATRTSLALRGGAAGASMGAATDKVSYTASSL